MSSYGSRTIRVCDCERKMNRSLVKLLRFNVYFRDYSVLRILGLTVKWTYYNAYLIILTKRIRRCVNSDNAAYYFQENPVLFLDSRVLHVALGQSRPLPVRRLCCLRRQEVQRRRQLREEDGLESKDIICQKSSWKRRDDFEMICNIIT